MRAHAAPDSDAPVTEGAGASPVPLLSGALKDRALHLVGALTETLRPAPAADHRDASLSSGSAGLAVCNAQLAWTRRDRRAAGAALTRLEEAIDVLATEPLTSSLYSGFTGIAWAVETVDRLLRADGEDRNGDIDEALTSLLRRYPEQAPYDLVNGLTGLGVYALARWPRPAAAQCILGVVEQLARRARHDRDGVYWWTPPIVEGPATGAVPARRGGSRGGARHRRHHPVPRSRAQGRAGPADRPAVARRSRRLAAGPHGRHRVRAHRPVFRGRRCGAGTGPLRLVLRRPRGGCGAAACGTRRR